MLDFRYQFIELLKISDQNLLRMVFSQLPVSSVTFQILRTFCTILFVCIYRRFIMILRTVAQFILATEKVRLKFYFVHSPMQQRNDIT